MPTFRFNQAQGTPGRLAELLFMPGARRLEASYEITTTNAAHNVEDDAGETIADIGTTAGTWVVASAADEAAMRGAIIQVTYRNNSGTLKWATATLNAGDSSTEVAFSPAISDGYMLVSMISLTTPAAQNVTMGPTGARTIGTIVAAAASATEANMHGIGSLWVQSDTNDNAYDDNYVVIEYVNGWGQVKWAVAAYDNTATTTEVRFYESTQATPATATTTSVKDFHHLRWAYSTVAVQAGDDVEMGNSDTSAIYACMSAGFTRWQSTRYYAPAKAPSTDGVVQSNGQAYIAHARWWKSDATTVCSLVLTCTPYGADAETTYTWTIVDSQIHELVAPIPLTEKSHVAWTIVDDNVAHPVLHLEVTYVEVPG